MLSSQFTFYRHFGRALWGVQIWKRIGNLALAYREGKKVQWRMFTQSMRRALLAYGWDCYARKVGRKYQLIISPISPSLITSSDYWADPIVD